MEKHRNHGLLRVAYEVKTDERENKGKCLIARRVVALSHLGQRKCSDMKAAPRGNIFYHAISLCLCSCSDVGLIIIMTMT